MISIGKYFSVKLHKICQSDDVCSHNHPWPFLTIILKGGYFEWTPTTQKEGGDILKLETAPDGITEVCRWHPAGSVMYRPAKWRHRLELKERIYLVSNKEGVLMSATTLVFTGTVIRDWGFFTKSGWIFWKDYNKQKHC